MKNEPTTSDALNALRNLTLEEVEKRLADIDGERASLSLLRRSLVARRLATNRTQQRSLTQKEGHRDE
jgi:hypothetical protein